jgi:hypothetical protein
MEGGAAYNDGRISVGDRLVAVRHLPNVGDFYLDDCSHEEAVKALKASKERVVLLISKADNHYPFEISPREEDNVKTILSILSINQSINHDQPIHQLTNQPIDQSIKSFNQPTNQSKKSFFTFYLR